MDFSPYLWLAMFRGSMLIYTGRLEDGRRQLDHTLELVRRYDEPEISGWVHGNYVVHAQYSCVYEGALEHAHRAVEVAEKSYSSFSRSAD